MREKQRDITVVHKFELRRDEFPYDGIDASSYVSITYVNNKLKVVSIITRCISERVKWLINEAICKKINEIDEEIEHNKKK